MSAAAAALPLRPFASRLGRRLLALALVAVALGALYLLWIRDAGVFAVETVRVEGVEPASPGAEQLRRALTEAGKEMTTLHVRPELLEEAAAGFPMVAAVSAEPDFPSGLTVRVSERRPVALIGAGADAVAVAEDGSILRGAPADGLALPRLPTDEVPRRQRLAGHVLEQARVLGAAPQALLAHATESGYGSRGVVVVLDSGIELRFGDASKAERKWRAAAAVLADPLLTALDYVDLTSARRPAAGGAGIYLPAAP